MDPGRHGTALVAVLAIIDEEFEEVCGALEVDQVLDGTKYLYRGDATARDFEVVVAKARERSNIPATYAAKDILEDFRPGYLLLVGIAGAVAERDPIDLGDVIVPEYIHYGSFQKKVDGKSLRRYFAFDQPSVALHDACVSPATRSRSWTNKVTLEPPVKRNSQVRPGQLVSGESLLGDPSDPEQKIVLDLYDTALAIDMESVGVARAVLESRRERTYNPQYLVIRGISDFANVEGNNETRAEWKRYAAHIAAAFASDIVRRISQIEASRG